MGSKTLDDPQRQDEITVTAPVESIEHDEPQRQDEITVTAPVESIEHDGPQQQDEITVTAPVESIEHDGPQQQDEITVTAPVESIEHDDPQRQDEITITGAMDSATSNQKSDRKKSDLWKRFKAGVATKKTKEIPANDHVPSTSKANMPWMASFDELSTLTENEPQSEAAVKKTDSESSYDECSEAAYLDHESGTASGGTDSLQEISDSDSSYVTAASSAPSSSSFVSTVGIDWDNISAPLSANVSNIIHGSIESTLAGRVYMIESSERTKTVPTTPARTKSAGSVELKSGSTTVTPTESRRIASEGSLPAIDVGTVEETIRPVNIQSSSSITTSTDAVIVDVESLGCVDSTSVIGLEQSSNINTGTSAGYFLVGSGSTMLGPPRGNPAECPASPVNVTDTSAGYFLVGSGSTMLGPPRGNPATCPASPVNVTDTSAGYFLVGSGSTMLGPPRGDPATCPASPVNVTDTSAGYFLVGSGSTMLGPPRGDTTSRPASPVNVKDTSAGYFLVGSGSTMLGPPRGNPETCPASPVNVTDTSAGYFLVGSGSTMLGPPRGNPATCPASPVNVTDTVLNADFAEIAVDTDIESSRSSTGNTSAGYFLVGSGSTMLGPPRGDTTSRPASPVNVTDTSAGYFLVGSGSTMLGPPRGNPAECPASPVNVKTNGSEPGSIPGAQTDTSSTDESTKEKPSVSTEAGAGQETQGKKQKKNKSKGSRRKRWWHRFTCCFRRNSSDSPDDDTSSSNSSSGDDLEEIAIA